MLFEFIDSSEISFPSKGLLVGSSMNGYETCSCSLESLHKFCKKWMIFPAEAGFYRYWYLYRLCHLFNDLKCSISIDHEWWSVTTFYDFFCWTAHIDINSSDSISFDDFCSFSKHKRILSKNLNYKRIFIWIMCQGSSLEFLGMYESISWIEFRKYHRFRGNFFYYLTIWAISVAIHGCKSRYGSFCCEVRPESIHGSFI